MSYSRDLLFLFAEHIPVCTIIKTMKKIFFFLLFGLLVGQSYCQSDIKKVPDAQMQKIYEEVKTPFKYGLVMVPVNNSKKMDSPSVFRKGNLWYMSYIIYDGRGYETWLAKSENLLDWEKIGCIMSFSDDTTLWDCNQRAGYIQLQDYKWGGSYDLQKYNGKYWMTYVGGKVRGYEADLLSIGIAYTQEDPTTLHEWNRLDKPVLMSTDKDVRWWENTKEYKSAVLWDKKKLTGHEFVMYYNAHGDSLDHKRGAERIGMAVSDNMVDWKRYMNDPVLNHYRGITGDPVIQKIGNVWVMFYFGAFWQKDQKDGAFNNFACSYDLVNWTDWKGEKLIKPSEPYDNVYAHKSFVVKWKGVVYHFYCAVNNKDQRGIAVATSKDMGKGKLIFYPNQDNAENK